MSRILKLSNFIKKCRKQYHDSKYVYYRKESISIKCTKDDLENKLNNLISDGYEQIIHTTKRNLIKPKTYSFTYNDRCMYLSYYDGKQFFWITTNYKDDRKNLKSPRTFKEFSDMFKKRTRQTLAEAFGSTEQFFKRCVPQPLYHTNLKYKKFKWYDDVSKEDISSHYPSCACGILPDASTAIIKDGQVNPNSEYEFAFYIRSGHVSVYNEFDSRNYIDMQMLFKSEENKARLFKPNYFIKSENDKTILMKRANQCLKDEMYYYYNLKNNSPKDSKEYGLAKLFMLKFIGQMEQCDLKAYNSHPFAHLAAVIKWRANIKMFHKLLEIGKDNIVQLCVDGIIHRGPCIGTDEKELGNLVTEVKHGKFIHRGMNAYIIDDGVNREIRTSGYDIDTDKDIKEWKASKKVNFLKYMKEKYIIEEI